MHKWLIRTSCLVVLGVLSVSAAPPANDTCAGAVLLAEDAPHVQAVSNATHDTHYYGTLIETNRFGVWLRYVAPWDGELLVTLPPSNRFHYTLITGSCASARAVLAPGWQGYVKAGQEILINTMSSSSSYPLELRVRTAPHPANDTCTGAVALSEGTYAAGDITGARGEAAGQEYVDHSLWFTYTPPFAGTARVEMVVASNAYYPDAAVYTGTCGALKSIPYPADPLGAGFPCRAGQTYYIAAGRNSDRGYGPFQIRVACTPAPPPNDACGAAIPLSEGLYATAVTLAGGDDTGLVADVVHRGAWFTYTPTFSGVAHLDTCPSDFGTKLVVCSGPCGALRPVTVHTESGTCGGTRASVSFPCAAGITYRICAGGTNGAAGTLYLIAESEPLTNNTGCAAAGVLFDRQPLVQDTAGFPETASACAGTISNAAWFVYTPPFTGTATVETCGSEFATQIEAFSGDCSNLVSLGCGSGSAACSNRAAVSFPCVSGATYRICTGGPPDGGLLCIVAHATGRRSPNDFDGDGITDLGRYHAFSGSWHIVRSSGGQWRTNDLINTKFGFKGSRPVEGDFDGDGVADYALYEPATYRWFLGRSSAGYTNFTLGWMGATPVIADFDGDGRTDPAVYEPARGRWTVRNSSAGATNFVFGAPGSMPAVADFDGDGRADPAWFRPDDGLWRIQLSSGGTLQTNYGAMMTFSDGTTDRAIPLPADYDGDGRADLTVFYSAGASNQLRVRMSTLGRTNITVRDYYATSGDYDGNGAMDVAWHEYLNNVSWTQVRNPAGPAFRLAPVEMLPYADSWPLGETKPMLERQFSWIDDLPIFPGTPVTPLTGRTGAGRSFRIQLPAAGKRTTGVLTDSAGATAPIYLSGLDGAGFADSAGTAGTGPVSMLVRVTKQNTFPLGPWGTPLGFYFINEVTLGGSYRDQRGETTVSLTFYLFSFAAP